ncbi:MAG: GIY-YIG nuclease family protein [bacterium]
MKKGYKTPMQKKFKRTGIYYVYILECSDGTYYTGYTNDIKNRVREHNNSKRGARYLRGKRPVRLVWRKKYRYYKLAVQEERRIKNLRRWQKERLIREYKRK